MSKEDNLECYVCGKQIVPNTKVKYRRVGSRKIPIVPRGIVYIPDCKGNVYWRHSSCEPGSPKYMQNKKLRKRFLKMLKGD